MRGLTAIDLFAGAGGLSLGLIRAGFNVVAAVDYDELAVKTYRENIAAHAILAPIGPDFRVKELLKAAGIGRGECDLLAGGPPCQGFSVKRRGSDDDVRNDLLL